MPSRGRVWRRSLPQLSPCPPGKNGFQSPPLLGDTALLLCSVTKAQVSPLLSFSQAWKEPAKSKFCNNMSEWFLFNLKCYSFIFCLDASKIAFLLTPGLDSEPFICGLILVWGHPVPKLFLILMQFLFISLQPMKCHYLL